MTATGLVYIFTGNGKGKTSAALGVAIRAVGQGKRVAMVQWYKERRWKIGEHNVSVIARSSAGGGTTRQSRFEIYPMGQGFYKLPTDHASTADHQKAAKKTLKFTENLLFTKSATKGLTFCGQYFLIILDEVLNAVNDKLIDLIDLIDLISKRGQTHIILTGRNAPKELIDLADLVTEMKNIKHPYKKGRKATLGLDF